MSLSCNILDSSDACSFSGKPHLQRRPSKRLLGSVACLQRWCASVEHWKSGGEVGNDGKFQARKYRGLKSWEYNTGCNGMYNQRYDMVSSGIVVFPISGGYRHSWPCESGKWQGTMHSSKHEPPLMTADLAHLHVEAIFLLGCPALIYSHSHRATGWFLKIGVPQNQGFSHGFPNKDDPFWWLGVHRSTIFSGARRPAAGGGAALIELTLSDRWFIQRHMGRSRFCRVFGRDLMRSHHHVFHFVLLSGNST